MRDRAVYIFVAGLLCCACILASAVFIEKKPAQGYWTTLGPPGETKRIFVEYTDEQFLEKYR